MATAKKTLHIQYYRSAIGRSWRQKQIIQGLGITKLQQVVERPDNAGFRGMVAKVPHLLRIVDGRGPQPASGGRPAYTRTGSGAPEPQAGAARKEGAR